VSTQAVFYKDAKGLEPVRTYLRSELSSASYELVARQISLLHILRKDSRAVPRRDIELAQRRWQTFSTVWTQANDVGRGPSEGMHLDLGIYQFR
jgi:phage-related protein